MIKRKINMRTGVLLFAVCVLLYCLVSLAVPPLFYKKGTAGTTPVSYGEEGRAPERIRLIDDNNEALDWRIRLIDSARESLILSTFDFRDDESGRDVMSALYAAAERGVQVRILTDGLSGQLRLKKSLAFRELTAHENVEARFYNKVSLVRPWKANYRMHDKYVIADDSAFLLGGRNTYDLFLGDFSESSNEDRDILVYETEPGQGNAYRQLHAYFQQVWEEKCSKSFQSRGSRQSILAGHYRELKESRPWTDESVEWMAETEPADGIALLSNPVEPSNKVPSLWKQVVSVMGEDSDAVIISPYIVMNEEMYADVGALKENGTAVSIITNASESGANPFGCSDYISEKERILEEGVRVYEYWGRHSLHTKTILVGQEISIVGSYNLDIRSTYLDTELMLCIKSRDFNRRLRDEAQLQIAQSKCAEKGREDKYGENYEFRSIETSKKVKYEILRRLIKPFRQLL